MDPKQGFTHHLTHRNHLCSGFLAASGGLEDYVPGGKHYIEIGECENAPGSPLEEAIRAAKKIRASTDKELWLCLSGGVDSECMALAFLAAEISFQAAILRFNDGLNDFDIIHAIRFCESRSIPYRFFDLNIPDFYLGGAHFEIAHRYRCTSPQLTAHLELMKRIPGFPVFAWSAPHIYLTETGKSSIGMPADLHFSYNRFLRMENRGGVPFFFLYTPELFYSFIRLPILQDILFQRGCSKGLSMGYREKCLAYQLGGFEIEPREDKYTGFEKVKVFFENHFSESGPTFDLKFRYPLQEIYPLESRTYCRFSKKFIIT
jgi:hypothetical protein